MPPLSAESAVELARLVRSHEVSAVEIIDQTRASVTERNPELVAFVYVDWENARQEASELDAKLGRGEPAGPLAGVPFGVKDLDDCAGMPTSMGSLIYKDGSLKTVDSPHVSRLRGAGAIPVGKTAASEFGMDSATVTRAWGVTRNPWNLQRTPGGSSGGSAAAVASRMVPLATSSDLGGSTRTPAAFTGLVGLKPSQGRIPQRSGTSELGMHGVITRTVLDTARALDVMSGPWAGDRMALPSPPSSFEQAIEQLNVRGLRAAWSGDLGFAAVEPEVATIAQKAAMALCDAARLVLSDKALRFSEPAPIIFNIEFPRWIHDLRRRGIWPEKRDLLSNAALWAADYGLGVSFEQFLDAELALVVLRRELSDFFEHHDVLLTPTVACTAYGADAPYPTEVNGRDVAATTIEPFTQLATLGWLPAVTVPAGLSSDGLPIGLQIMAALHRDDVALRLARVMEIAEPWPAGPPRPTPPTG